MKTRPSSLSPPLNTPQNRGTRRDTRHSPGVRALAHARVLRRRWEWTGLGWCRGSREHAVKDGDGMPGDGDPVAS